MRPGAFLLAAALLAGCAAGPSAEPTGPTGLDVRMDPQECRLARVAHLADPAAVSSHLPPGFTYREASAYLGQEFAPEGNALVILGVMTCASAAHDAQGLHIGELALFVEAPSVPGEREEAVEDFYVPTLYTSGSLLALARNASWVVEESTMDVEVTAPPAGARATGGWSAGDATLAFEVAGALDVHHEGLERYWQETPAGIGYIEALTSIDQRALAAQCEVSSGSLAAELVGPVACAPGRAYGLAVLDGEWTYRFVSLPGAHASA